MKEQLQANSRDIRETLNHRIRDTKLTSLTGEDVREYSQFVRAQLLRLEDYFDSEAPKWIVTSLSEASHKEFSKLKQVDFFADVDPSHAVPTPKIKSEP